MAVKPVSTLAAVIVLHGGPKKEVFEAILQSMRESTVVSEDFEWGPSYSLACKRRNLAIKAMEDFVRRL